MDVYCAEKQLKKNLSATARVCVFHCRVIYYALKKPRLQHMQMKTTKTPVSFL